MIRDWKWLEACSKVVFSGQVLACSDLVYTTNQLVFPFIIKQVQPRALELPAITLSFIHFGKFLKIAHGQGSLVCDLFALKLTSKHVI